MCTTCDCHCGQPQAPYPKTESERDSDREAERERESKLSSNSPLGLFIYLEVIIKLGVVHFDFEVVSSMMEGRGSRGAGSNSMPWKTKG